MKLTRADREKTLRARAMGWPVPYGEPVGGREKDAETLVAMAGGHIAYRLAFACDPEWDPWASANLIRVLLAAGDVLTGRTRGRDDSRLTPGSRRAAVRLVASLCPDERLPALGIFLRVVCPDVHDETGIRVTRQDLVPALAGSDPEVGEFAMRVVELVIL